MMIIQPTLSRRMSAQARFRRAAGFSLIELLIAITIGMVIVGAALSAYLGAAESGRLTTAESRMNEDAQTALDLLAQQIRMAGNNPKRPNYALATPRNPITNTFSLRGCNSTFTNIKAVGATPAAADINSLTCPVGSGTHSIAVSYEADTFNTTPAAGVPTDCIGSALPAQNANVTQITSPTTTGPVAVVFYEADNRFYIETSATSGRPSLYCRGNGGAGTPQPLIENIEDLQLTYGTSQAASGAGTVAGYLGATDFVDNTKVALATDRERWARVVTVRICVVARSESPILSDAASARYIKCDGTVETSPPDLRMRRAYFATISLRNRIEAP